MSSENKWCLVMFVVFTQFVTWLCLSSFPKETRVSGWIFCEMVWIAIGFVILVSMEQTEGKPE